MVETRKWLGVVLLASAVTGYSFGATAAPNVYELRMNIVDARGKVLATPKLQLPTGKEATLVLLVEGWKTNITVALKSTARAYCRQLKVDFNEEKTAKDGGAAHRSAATTSDVCDSKPVTLGDEKARKLFVSLHEVRGNE